jgi:hypothetical protein
MSISCVQNAGQSHSVKVAVYQSTQRKFPNEFNLQQLRSQNLKSNIKISNTYCGNVAEFKCFWNGTKLQALENEEQIKFRKSLLLFDSECFVFASAVGKGTDQNLFFFVGMKLGFSH